MYDIRLQLLGVRDDS